MESGPKGVSKQLVEKARNEIQSTEVEKQEIDLEEQINNIKEIKYEVKGKKTKRTIKIGIKQKRDYVKEAKLKVDFGKRCEKIILETEKRNLIKAGRKDLANKVEWTSQQPGGDGKGYDIVSFRKKNNQYEQVYIEVKGTNKDYDEAFEISILEIEASEKYAENYYLCRVAKASTKNPIYYETSGRIRDNFDLAPIKYKATKKE